MGAANKAANKHLPSRTIWIIMPPSEFCYATNVLLCKIAAVFHAVVMTSGIAAIIWHWWPIAACCHVHSQQQGCDERWRGWNEHIMVLWNRCQDRCRYDEMQLLVGCCGIGVKTGGKTGRGLTAT